jgi:RecB family endonuclease NucS
MAATVICTLAEMTAIWQHRDDEWRLLAPSGFPDEATLHSQVEDAPQLLPLAGSPLLAVVGREVRLGTGYADLIAVEDSGRPVVIEIKLASNS